jgi:hypothetical protein
VPPFEGVFIGAKISTGPPQAIQSSWRPLGVAKPPQGVAEIIASTLVAQVDREFSRPNPGSENAAAGQT